MAIFATPLEVTIKYCFSNLLSLFIGGLFFIPPIVTYIIMLITAELADSNEYLFLAMFGVFLLSLLICVIITGGFIIRCVRDRRAGGLRMPDFYSEPVKLLSDIFAFMVMTIVYAICFAVIIAVVLALLLLVPSTTSAIGFLAMFVFMFIFIGVFAITANVLFFTFFVSLTIYAAEGSLLSALNPVRIVKVIASNPVSFLVALVLVYGVGSILQILALFIITMPWLFFIMLLLDALLVADIYLATERKNSGPEVAQQPAI